MATIDTDVNYVFSLSHVIYSMFSLFHVLVVTLGIYIYITDIQQ